MKLAVVVLGLCAALSALGASSDALAQAGPGARGPGDTPGDEGPRNVRDGGTVSLNGSGRQLRAATVSDRRPDEYAGIAPGLAHLPRGFSRGARRNGRPVVTWPGFQMTAEGSRVFLAVAGPVTVDSPQSANGRVVYRLRNTSISLRNNRRPLETAGFATPLERVSVRQVRRDVELVLELRAQSQGTLTQQNAGEGLTFVLVDFPRYSLPEGATPGAGLDVRDSTVRATGAPREGAARGTAGSAGTGRGQVMIRPSQDAPPTNENERPPPVQP